MTFLTSQNSSKSKICQDIQYFFTSITIARFFIYSFERLLQLSNKTAFMYNVLIVCAIVHTDVLSINAGSLNVRNIRNMYPSRTEKYMLYFGVFWLVGTVQCTYLHEK